MDRIPWYVPSESGYLPRHCQEDEQTKSKKNSFTNFIIQRSLDERSSNRSGGCLIRYDGSLSKSLVLDLPAKRNTTWGVTNLCTGSECLSGY